MLQKQKMILLITALVLLIVAAAVFTHFYLGQQKELADLQEALTAAEKQYSVLLEEFEALQEELKELQADYQRLLEESESSDSSPPVRDNPPEQAPGGSFPGGSGPTAYLTIDDGPSLNTVRLLEILKEYRVPATFFVTGNNVSGESGIYRRIIAEGHALGNHTYTHNFEKIYQFPEAFMEDFLHLENFLYQETGKRLNIMRFPGGSSSSMARTVSGYNIIVEDLIARVTQLGYDYFDWNITSGDHDSAVTAREIVDNVKEQEVRIRGSELVLLFHDGRNNQATVEALPEIIELLKERGYEFALLHKGAVNVKHR